MLEAQERYPRSKEAIPNFREAFRHYIMPSFVPATPPLSRAGYILTQGSCFAENVAKTLGKAGIKSNWFELDEVINSPLANRTYLEYALTDKPVVNENHKLVLAPHMLKHLRETVAEATAFIFTVGLAYCRFNVDGEFHFVGVKGVPERFRLTTVDENQAHIEAIIAMVKAVNPTIKIILTLSPIPLTRSIGHGSAFVSDCTSKSILRAALAQVMERQFPDVYYWPSFDAIRWLSGHIGPLYGVEGQDQRHPGQSFIDVILEAFVESFFAP